jgi:mannose-1-phosphate guanylyltransferase/phosphomannomutase
MKAVVMAGGEGTRLRPVTSNQPKPMVPIVGKPCMEHILELLARHGFDEVIITLAFLPQAIRSYFGSGESVGLELEYSVEESPLGTAGSVRLASGKLDETFLVISGDALCDIDLTRLVDFHHERGAAVTIGLKAVDNPLEFGIVVTDADGRVERFLEKPSWGQVFSDTINTGIYVIDPEVLRHVPTDRPFDFSKELFPLLLEMGRPIYGHVCDGYWQDIGNLEQFRQANFDALDGRVDVEIPGVRLRGNVWLGEGVELDELDKVEGPAFIGNYCSIAPDASVGAYSVLSPSVTLLDGARVSRSVIDASTHVGRSALVEGAAIGRNCDIRSHVRIHEGAAIGDEVLIGAESVVAPGVRIYPFKEVESGAHIFESLIWESRASPRLFGREGVTGLINVDLTPETAVRLGVAFGTALPRGARVVASREAPDACRMIKRAIIAGLNSTGIHVDDLRTLTAPVCRHHLRTQSYEAGIHVGTSTHDAETVQVWFFEQPGIGLTPELQKEIEKHYLRQEFRRVGAADVGSLGYPARVREGYAEDLLATVDAAAIRARGFRIVVDYGYSAASFVLPLVLGPLGIEVVSAHAFHTGRSAGPSTVLESVAQARQLVAALGVDLGAVLDRSGERLYLIDGEAQEVDVDRAGLLFLRLLAQRGRAGKVAFPVTATAQVDRIVAGTGLDVVRTASTVSDLTRAAASGGVVFADAGGGRYVFPDFLPAADACAALCKLLELLAPMERPLAALVADLPELTLVHRRLPCPWGLKGLVMRVLGEQLKGRELDLTDGVKAFDARGWAQALPDPVEPLVHVYAEGETAEDSRRLADELAGIVEEIIESGSADVRAGTPEVSSSG